MTPQTDKAAAEVYLDGKEYSASTIIKSVNEYDALCKVAECAGKFLTEKCTRLELVTALNDLSKPHSKNHTQPKGKYEK